MKRRFSGVPRCEVCGEEWPDLVRVSRAETREESVCLRCLGEAIALAQRPARRVKKG